MLREESLHEDLRPTPVGPLLLCLAVDGALVHLSRCPRVERLKRIQDDQVEAHIKTMQHHGLSAEVQAIGRTLAEEHALLPESASGGTCRRR